MRDWIERKYVSGKSKGGVTVVGHPLDNLISTGCAPWPTPEVVQKLYQSRHFKAFQEEELTKYTACLGYYCDLQSLYSEDAITWSVWGL